MLYEVITGVAQEEIETVLGEKLRVAGSDNTAPKAPGMLTSHYAPSLPVRLGQRRPPGARDGLLLAVAFTSGAAVSYNFV